LAFDLASIRELHIAARYLRVLNKLVLIWVKLEIWISLESHDFRVSVNNHALSFVFAGNFLCNFCAKSSLELTVLTEEQMDFLFLSKLAYEGRSYLH